MKKYTMFLLIFVLAGSFIFGCGQNGRESETENETTQKTEQESDQKTKDGKKKASVDREVKSKQDEDDVSQPEETEINSERETQETSKDETAGQTGSQDRPILNDLQIQLDERLGERRGLGESWAVYAERLSDGAYVSTGNQALESASLIKLYTAAVAEIFYSELETQESYPGETNMLLQNMISVSDNDAANTLVRRLGYGDAAAGMERINAFCQEQGFHETHMGRLMLDFEAADDNYTSPQDCVSLLKNLYNHQVTGSEQIIGFMKAQERTGKIPAGLPVGTLFANKTGELTDVENDTAIVFSETEDYIVCIMSNHLLDTVNARSLFAVLSADIYQYMTQE